MLSLVFQGSLNFTAPTWLPIASSPTPLLLPKGSPGVASAGSQNWCCWARLRQCRPPPDSLCPLGLMMAVWLPVFLHWLAEVLIWSLRLSFAPLLPKWQFFPGRDSALLAGYSYKGFGSAGALSTFISSLLFPATLPLTLYFLLFCFLPLHFSSIQSFKKQAQFLSLLISSIFLPVSLALIFMYLHLSLVPTFHHSGQNIYIKTHFTFWLFLWGGVGTSLNYHKWRMMGSGLRVCVRQPSSPWNCKHFTESSQAYSFPGLVSEVVVDIPILQMATKISSDLSLTVSQNITGKAFFHFLHSTHFSWQIQTHPNLKNSKFLLWKTSTILESS